MKTTKDAVVTKSALARALGCAPSSITHLINRGLPVRPDGRVERRAALQWIVGKTSGSGGGWSGQSRGRDDLRARAQRLLNGRQKAGAKVPRRVASPEVAADTSSVALDVLRRVCSASETLAFARVALRTGATPTQAFALALWHSCAPCLAIDEVDGDELCDFPEPTEMEWKQLLGADFDFAAADELHDKATGPEVNGKPGAEEAKC